MFRKPMFAALTLLATTATPFVTQPAEAAAIQQQDVTDASLVRLLPGFHEAEVTTNGVRIHYVEGGKGPTVVLLPGWPQTWWGFHKEMPALAQHYHVVSVDLRGMGASGRPAGGYDKKTMAADIAGLVRHLGPEPVYIVGHDIGSMVAYAFAANYPELTRKLVMLDVAHPDPSLAKWTLLPEVGTFGDKVGDGSKAYAWWFAYHQVKGLPEELGANGGIAKEQTWFFHYLTRDDRSIDARDRAVYAAAYSSRDAIRAGDAWYQAFPQDIADFATYGDISVPVLAIGGPGYSWLNAVVPPKAPKARVVRFTDSGHFIPDEVPDELLAQLADFLK